MGTNFYWNKDAIEQDDYLKKFFDVQYKADCNYFRSKGKSNLDAFKSDKNEYFYHIGKRSSAGNYCTKCGVSLCEGGYSGVHLDVYNDYDKCPICGSKGEHVCSFTWYDYNRDTMLISKLISSPVKYIKDEYGEEYTISDFMRKEMESSKIYFFSKELFG